MLDVRERLLGRTPGGDDVVGCKLKSSEAPEETHESTLRDSMQDQLPQQPQQDVQTHRPTRQRVRPVCITEQQRQRNRRNRPA
ncbi:hypothetical protein Scep_006919 [Stephania cephalantha]|uniref:Uncharacterized protein n=1 Tax=Stephania cephalantha TaxID=152367 RepID=A0AAP0PLA2_9MAGN